MDLPLALLVTRNFWLNLVPHIAQVKASSSKTSMLAVWRLMPGDLREYHDALPSFKMRSLGKGSARRCAFEKGITLMIIAKSVVYAIFLAFLSMSDHLRSFKIITYSVDFGKLAGELNAL